MQISENSKPGRALQAAKPAARRSVSIPDYVMPKPYRKTVFASGMRKTLPGAQIVLIGGVVVVVAGLVFMLALMARAYFDGKRHAAEPPKVRAQPARVVQAPEPPAPVKARKGTKPRIAGPVPPAAIKVAKKVPPAIPERPKARNAAAGPAAHGQPVARNTSPQTGSAPLPPAPADHPPPDPDADVIASLLTLFPKGAPAPRSPSSVPCVTAADKAAGCEAAQVKRR